MIERAFARTLRNYWTIFTIVAVVTFPVHLVYAFAFRNVIATSAYHNAIQADPRTRAIGGVTPAALERERIAFWGLTAIELALIPIAARATRRAFTIEEAGVPTATDGWRHALMRGGVPLGEGTSAGAVAAGVSVAVIVGLLLAGIGGTALDVLPDRLRWVGIALADGTVRAGSAPFALGVLALVRAKERGSRAPKLY